MATFGGRHYQIRFQWDEKQRRRRERERQKFADEVYRQAKEEEERALRFREIEALEERNRIEREKLEVEKQST
jgi:hypothetical protein